MELYILNQDDQLLTVLTESTGLVSTWFKDHLNRVPDEPFVFTVEADMEETANVKEENQVVFRDKEGDLRLFVIKELDDSDGVDGPETIAVCEPAFMELKEHIIVDRRFANQTADRALTAALEGTRWTGEVDAVLGQGTTNFYYISAVDAVWKTHEVWGGDIKDVVEFDGKAITERKIKLLQRLGTDRGHRYEIDHNIEGIQRTILSYPVTALYGRGASLQLEDESGEATGGYSRYIDFADVEWKKSAGDPVDKPKGQKWVGDPEALQKYGRLHEGQMLHREGIFSNQEYEDPAELLSATWIQLQDSKGPEINYRLSVQLLESLAGYEHERASLGDTSRAIDRNFSRPIEIQARVIAIEYDVMDIKGTAVVEMGQFLSAHDYDDRLDRVIGTINDNRGKWESAGQIENGNFPDIKPNAPTNFSAVGAYKTVQLQWDFDSEVYISHYELYGSQVKDFLPDTQHLLYRGPLNGFSHLINVDEVWYYRVRAINTRGTASNYSGQAMGSAIRVISDDILFGPELAAEIKELSKTSDILADGAVGTEKMKQEALDSIQSTAKQYTDAEIQAAETAINSELAQKAGLSYVDGKFSLVESDISGQTAQIGSLQNVADDLQTRVMTAEGELSANGGRLTTVETDINRIDGSVSATISTLSNIESTLSSQQTQLDANASEISLKASQASVNTLTGKVDDINTELSVQAGQITLKAEASALTTVDNKVTGVRSDLSALSIRAYGITQSVSSLQSDFDGLDIGGRNLVPNSNAIRETVRHYIPLVIENPFADGEEVAISYDVKTKDGGEINHHFYLRNMTTGSAIVSSGRYMISGEWKRIKGVVKLPNSINNPGEIRLTVRSERYMTDDGTDYITIVKNIKVEKGNKATDWTPAPEDVDAAIGSVSTRVTSAESSINQLNDSIALKAEQSQVTTLAGNVNSVTSRVGSLEVSVNGITSNVSSLDSRLGSAESTIEQQAGEIQSRVTSTTFTQSMAGKENSIIKQNTAPAHAVGRLWLNTSVTPNVLQRSTGSAWVKVTPTTAAEIAAYSTSQGNALAGRVSTAESNITQQAAEIALKVNKDGLISEINLQPGTVKIKAALIDLIGDVYITNGRTYISDLAVGSAAIANGAITRAKLGTAVIGTAQIEDAAITNAKIGSVSADKITVGTLSGIELNAVRINGSRFYSERDSSHYTLIEGPAIESRGHFARTWRNVTTTSDIRLRLQDGYLRARNETLNRSLYYSDFGLSTYVDGDGQEASGTLSFFNTDYSVPRGVSLQSGNGAVSLVSDANRIVLDANATINIESETSSIYLRPMRNNRMGTNEFRYWVKDNPSGEETDGVLTYGRFDTTHGSGIRFGKSATHNLIYATNNNGDMGSGSFVAETFRGALMTESTNAYVMVDGALRVTDKNGYNAGNTSYRDIEAQHIASNTIRTRVSNDFYIGCSTAEVRITNNLFWNGGNTGYRPIRASSFLNGSSRKYKTNIEEVADIGLTTLNQLVIVEYDLIEDIQNGVFNNRQIGLISEDSKSVATIDGEAINMYKLNSLNVKATQELASKVSEQDLMINKINLRTGFVEKRLADLEKENGNLKQRIQALEEAA